jgi:hypothetical protein
MDETLSTMASDDSSNIVSDLELLTDNDDELLLASVYDTSIIRISSNA